MQYFIFPVDYHAFGRYMGGRLYCNVPTVLFVEKCELVSASEWRNNDRNST